MDIRTYSAVLDHHAGALSAAIDLLLEDEVVQWLFPASIPLAGVHSPAAALLVITGRRLLALPQPTAGIPVAWWPLNTLSSAVLGNGPTGGKQWLDVQLGGTRLRVLVDRYAVAVRAETALHPHQAKQAELLGPEGFGDGQSALRVRLVDRLCSTADSHASVNAGPSTAVTTRVSRPRASRRQCRAPSWIPVVSDSVSTVAPDQPRATAQATGS